MPDFLEYYSRKDVQRVILESARNREVAVKYPNGSFGKRPDILNFENDVFELARSGATSFHISEEHWKNPLLLKPGMTKNELDRLRIGWDLCLPEYEHILIVKDKETRVITFKDLAEELKINKIGRHKINDRINIYSIEKDSMKIRKDQIKEFIVRNQKPNEKVVKITIENGKEVNTSPDHPFLIFTNEGIKTKKAKELSEKDYLLTPLKVDLDRRKNKINLIDLMVLNRVKDDYNIRYKNTKLSRFILYNLTELESNIRGTLKNSISKKGIPFNLYPDLDGNLEYKSKAYLGYARSKTKIPVSIRLTKEFGKLIGYYLAEGCACKNTVEFVLNIKETKEAEEIVNLTKNIFKTDFNVNIKEYREKNSLKIIFHSKLLSIIYKDILGFSHLAHKKKIPDWTYSAPTGFISGILSTYFVGDGCPIYESNDFSLRISSLTASQKLLEGLSLFMLNLGIHHNILKKPRKNIISISGEEGIKKFNHVCGLSFIKRKNLKFTSKKINHPSTHTCYPPFFDVIKIRLIKHAATQKNLYRAIRLNYRVNKKLAKLAANEYLSKIIQSDIFPIKIKKIEEIEYTGLFYDIETRKNNNFLHGDGIFTHNCLDIDTKFIEYSRETALLLIKALRHYNIKNIGLKFSGGSGFHLGIPFSSLPEEINGKDTKLLFPEVPRAIAAYIKEMIKQQLKEKILDISTIQEIKSATGKEEKDLLENKEFNPFSIIEIDTILISNRHMYRSPYSLNEKRGLISLVLPIDDLKSFNLKKARIENIKKPIPFLPETREREATQLVIQALDAVNKRPRIYIQEQPKAKHYEELKTSIPDEFFPQCITKLLKGVKQDGRKRALFILINFLKSMGYSMEQVENIIKKWNQRNYQPLGESYLLSQLSWHKRQQETVLPPNCSNESYYKDLGVKCPEEICSRCKNPVQFAKRRFFAYKKNRPRRRKE